MLTRGIKQSLDIPAGKSIVANAGGTDFEARYTDPDYYRYSIVPTVASNNLTVTLKNYLGNDPSASAPVKVQIGDTIRTITSALSWTDNAGTNYLNLGSNELTTKEVDLFCYLNYRTSNSTIYIGWSRIPSATTVGDFTVGITNEKGVTNNINGQAITDKVQNIGRFSAILSAGAGHTWTLGTGPTINQYINVNGSNNLVPTLSTGTTMTFTSTTISLAKYSIINNKITCSYTFNGTIGGILNRSIIATLPFNSQNGVNIYRGIGLCEDAGGNALSCEFYITGSSTIVFRPPSLANFGAGNNTFYCTFTYEF